MSVAPPTLLKVVVRICKICTDIFTRGIAYQGAILLVPVVMKDINTKSDSDSPCGAIHGSQFLIVTVLFGVCHLLGRFLNCVANNRISSTMVLMSASLIVLPFIVVIGNGIFSHKYVLLFTGFGVIQIAGSFSGNQTYLFGNDKKFFTDKYLAISGSFQASVHFLVIAVSNAISEILAYQVTLHVQCVFCALNFLVSLTFLLKDWTLSVLMTENFLSKCIIYRTILPVSILDYVERSSDYSIV